MDEPFFWSNGMLAKDISRISHDPSALDEKGFWVVVAEFEGAWTCVRFETVVAAPLPALDWIGLDDPWVSTFDSDNYQKYVQNIRELIAEGTVYQVTACRILETYCEQSLLGLFNKILIANPSPYAAYLQMPGLQIASASPELFLSFKETAAGVEVMSSPIKGTADEPFFGTKDQAENVMIVDLIRNDLGQICQTGTVEVPRLLAIEEHPGLFHLVSDVAGILKEDATWSHIAKAMMPPGSVSGAPKSSAVEIIARMEPVPRGPYCGAFGWVNADSACLAVGIRLFWKAKTPTIKFGTGAGITWGSDPQAEWIETELKAKRLIAIASGTAL